VSVRVWTVGELTRRIRDLLETQVDRVWVQGEIGSFKAHPSSGHAYFNLKDEKAVLACVAWARTVQALSRSMDLRDGIRVRAFGRITVYEPRGAYQLVVEQVLKEGEGDLQAAFQRLKMKLEAEGLFDPTRKRVLPRIPGRIGLVTSPSGAALRDLLRILGRRWPLCEVVLRPAAVQGAGASVDLAEGIRELNELGGIDLLIVGRGGGSLEDLWAFNEEPLARAIYASAIPVISAVGHEVDFTISDLVADVRAATPSHAAEMAVPDQEEFRRRLIQTRRILGTALQRKRDSAHLRLERLRMSRGLRRPESLLQRGRLDQDRLADRLREGLTRRAEAELERLRSLGLRLDAADPSERLRRQRRRLEDRGRALETLCLAHCERVGRRRDLAEARLGALDPRRVLSRGYGIVTRLDSGRILRRAYEVDPGAALMVRLHSGRLRCTVDEVEGERAGRSGGGPGESPDRAVSEESVG
jgi:exodeoxyribonuclease VII large subunit